jgi:hypothetical protein
MKVQWTLTIIGILIRELLLHGVVILIAYLSLALHVWFMLMIMEHGEEWLYPPQAAKLT